MAETVAGLLAEGRRLLQGEGIATAALDARLLLQEVTGLRHDQIIAEPQRVVAESDVLHLRVLLARRAAHEPVSRILGRREFHGRDFAVTPAVLDPRPDTETLVEAVLAAFTGRFRVLDLGAGSGAIVVSLLAERPLAEGTAVDVSPEALAVVQDNARRHGVAARLVLAPGSWFEPVIGRFDLIVSNPPYIPAGDIAGLEPDVRDYDPHLALAGGADGLAAYRALAAGARAHLTEDGMVMVEIGAGQGPDVEAIFLAAGLALRNRFHDLGGHVRVLAFA